MYAVDEPVSDYCLVFVDRIFAVQAYQDPGGNGPPARNYNRGIEHHLNVPWPTACGLLGIARTCVTIGANRVAELTGQQFCQ